MKKYQQLLHQLPRHGGQTLATHRLPLTSYHSLLTSFLLLFSIFHVSCGFYSMAGSIPPHIRSVAIPLVENQTAEFAMAETVTDNLQIKFTDENILRVIDEKNADSVLKGIILKVEDGPYTYNKEEAVMEYHLTVSMKMEWIDVANDKVLLSKQYSGWGAYGLSGDISADGIDNDGDGVIDGDDIDEIGDPREFATKVAVVKIAEDVLNDILSSW